eukprot:TRINITY_DN11463_c0_g1_i1.p2 TRINITY_DN11463_c0_g1~~TRINITY_DN11463_c0_g1_i1.p2  ORF type:complete len:110 (-),score=19.71 TRINITY_DN11463_c0_g1_i1:128-457(-)
MQQVGGHVTTAGAELLNIIDTGNQVQIEQAESEHTSMWMTSTWSVLFIICSAIVLLARSVVKKSILSDSKVAWPNAARASASVVSFLSTSSSGVAIPIDGLSELRVVHA